MQIVNDRVRDTANISVTSNVIAYPASNLSIDRKSSTWKSTSNASQTITVTWTNALDVNAVSLAHHNFDENTIVRVKYFDTAANTSPIYDSGNLLVGYSFEPPSGFSTNSGNSFPYGGGNYFVHQTNTFSAQKIEITVSGDTPDGYYEIARVVAGNVIRTEFDAESASVGIVDESEGVRTEGGDVLVNQAIVYRQMNLAFSALSIDDRNNLINLLRKVGSKYPVLVMERGYRENSIDKSLMLYGRLDALSLDLMQRYRSATSLKIEEY